jgi:diguanylate cyclase (GGDEF)-like protein
MRQAVRTLLAALAMAVVCALPWAAAAQNTENREVRVQLKWKHQFQFAGFYAAEAMGYFKDAGLNVTLVEGGPTIDPAGAVVAGRAEFGIGNSNLIIDRASGKPVMAVAAFFQRSPFVVLMRRDDGIVSVRDLEGRTLMVEEHAAELIAYLRLAGVDVTKVRMVPHTGNIRDLAAGNAKGIDAATAYSSTEPYFAIRADIPVRTFDPRDAGIDFYGDTLFTTQAFAEANPNTVRAMRDAVIRGWEYALAHQDEIITYILKNYAPGDDRSHLGFEAQVTKSLIGTDLADIGYMSTSRWRHIADVFARAGLMTEGFPLDGFMFEDDEGLPGWVYTWLIWLGILALLASLLAHRFYLLSRNLKQEIARREALEEELRTLATTDPLSGLANRRLMLERAMAEFARSRRHRHDLCLIVLDLDRFKQINDSWGHAFGDRCIRAVANACQSVLRDIDLAARFGGDEFVIMLPETDAASARKVAERLRDNVRTLVAEPNGTPLSVSIGLGFLTEGDTSIDDLIARADADMYRDKRTRR